MTLNIDYVSDIHLKFYVKNVSDIKSFVEKNIVPKIKSSVLIIAGDICEYFDYVSELLYDCSKYYDKVIFIAGNHEYYIPNMKFIYIDEMGKKFDNNSLNKIKKLDDIYKDSSNIIFLDRNSSNHGICNIDGYSIAGDTLWYLPKNLLDWIYYYKGQRDSSFIMGSDNSHNRIIKLHQDSINWYKALPNNLDLMISHIPPMKIKNNGRGNDCCYHVEVSSYKAKTWVYGHDHKENEFVKDETLFLSNPWGYNSKDFKVKTLTLNK